MFMFHFKKYVKTPIESTERKETKTEWDCSMFCNFTLPEGGFIGKISIVKKTKPSFDD